MGIKGLTDRGMSFPEIGFIRKGKMGDNRPIDLQYFRVEIAEPESQEKFLALYGQEPTEIRIMFPFNEIEKNWDAWLEAYTAGRMVARSDGEKMLFWVDTGTGEVIVQQAKDKSGMEVPTPANWVVGNYKNKNGATIPIKLGPVGRMKVIIPELERMAYLTVHTTSYHDIASLSSQLEGFKTVNRGRLAGIPLILRRRPRMISTPDLKEKGKRVRREKWLLSIEADPEWVKKQLVYMSKSALPKPEEIALLTGEVEKAPEMEEMPEGMQELDEELTGISEGQFEEMENDYSQDFGDEPGQLGEPDPKAEMYDKCNAFKDKSGKSYGAMTVDELTTHIEKLAEYRKKNQSDQATDDRLHAARWIQNYKIEQEMNK